MHLEKPPIREAVIDIQVASRVDFDVEELASTANSLKEDFPSQSPIMAGNFSINITESGPNVKTQQDKQGFLLKTSDSQCIVQLKKQGLTFSLINHYNDWDEFREKFYGIWQKYLQDRGDLEVTRIGVRFINAIKVGDMTQLPSLLTSLPSFDPSITATSQPREFFYRSVFTNPTNPSITGIVSQAMNGNSNGISDELIIDVDAFTFSSLGASEDEGLLSTLDQLRTYKNSLFFTLLTDKMIKRLGGEER